MNEKADDIKKRYQYRSLILKRKLALSRKTATKLIGPDTAYQISILDDRVAPRAPTNLVCESTGATSVSLQWERSTRFEDLDVVGYEVQYASQVQSVNGAENTYYEATGLTSGQNYTMKVKSVDFSGNKSDWSTPVENCIPQPPEDVTKPNINLTLPTGSSPYTTTNTTMAPSLRKPV